MEEYKVEDSGENKTSCFSWLLRCIEDKSEIIGEEFEINYNVNSGSSINAQIKFNNLQKQLKPDKKVYYSFFQMFNQQNESFGNITKIKIKII